MFTQPLSCNDVGFHWLFAVWRRVEAISGREAVLPCEVGMIQEGDMIYVVLWYLNGKKEPIYR